jgi:hypothetical protein
MRYNSEVEVKDALGIESWRNLSRGTFLRFLAAMPEIDREVALQLIGQIPAITTLASAAIDDTASAYDDLLAANTCSMEMIHRIQVEQLAILRAELDKDLSPEERLGVLAAVRDVYLSALLKDTENKKFLAEEFDKRLAGTLTAALIVAAVVLSAAKSGNKPAFSMSRVLAA